jgi:hypothetical protein
MKFWLHAIVISLYRIRLIRIIQLIRLCRRCYPRTGASVKLTNIAIRQGGSLVKWDTDRGICSQVGLPAGFTLYPHEVQILTAVLSPDWMMMDLAEIEAAVVAITSNVSPADVLPGIRCGDCSIMEYQYHAKERLGMMKSLAEKKKLPADHPGMCYQGYAAGTVALYTVNCN